MATVRDLIKGSMRLIGAIATGETPSADEQADALYVLNDMIDSWSNEGLAIFATIREEFPLTAGQGDYTMGVGGDFNTARPLKIENAAVLSTGTPAYELPLELLNQDQWAAIPVKSTQSSLPRKLYAVSSNPLEAISLWPVPSTTSTLVLYSWKPLASFANANSTVSFPPGYSKALRYGLALELAPEYGKTPDPAIVIQAVEAKENIKRMNVKPVYLGVDDALTSRGHGFNWLTGE